MLCEICQKEYEHLDKHHIQSRCYGGSNDKSNKASICPNCHRLIHKGKIIIEGRFLCVPCGDRLVWRLKGKESITGVKDPKVYIMGKNEEQNNETI
jgi:hypothetical protein